MKIQPRYLFLVFFLISTNHFMKAQDIGTIYSKAEANQKFGIVIQSFSMKDTTISSLIAEAGNYIMFDVKNNQVIILGQKRAPLYPTKKTAVSTDEIFKVYSVNKVKELIKLGNNNTTIIEYRGNVISLTNGDYTLEEGAICPPFCYQGK